MTRPVLQSTKQTESPPQVAQVKVVYPADKPESDTYIYIMYMYVNTFPDNTTGNCLIDLSLASKQVISLANEELQSEKVEA